MKVAGNLPEALKRKNEAKTESFIGGRFGPRTLEKVTRRKDEFGKATPILA